MMTMLFRTLSLSDLPVWGAQLWRRLCRIHGTCGHVWPQVLVWGKLVPRLLNSNCWIFLKSVTFSSQKYCHHYKQFPSGLVDLGLILCCVPALTFGLANKYYNLIELILRYSYYRCFGWFLGTFAGVNHGVEGNFLEDKLSLYVMSFPNQMKLHNLVSWFRHVS